MMQQFNKFEGWWKSYSQFCPQYCIFFPVYSALCCQGKRSLI